MIAALSASYPARRILRHHDAEQPLFGELRNQLRWKAGCSSRSAAPGAISAFGELAHRLLQDLLFFT